MSRISMLALRSRRASAVALLVAATCFGVASAVPAASQARPAVPPHAAGSAIRPTGTTLPPRMPVPYPAHLSRAAITASPVKHVVVIYLENHSFDNILGHWCNSHPGRCPDGGMPAKVTLSNGTVVTPGVLPDTIPNVLHNVAAQVAAMNIHRRLHHLR
jgi:phospholipase C